MVSSVVVGTIWSFIQKFGGLAVGFISNMVLARLLCPDDFGVVGMVMVFVSMADVLVDGGLGNALIQKKDITSKDISTVFTTNLIFSLLLFSLCFICAPLIESYTGIENLSLYIRVESVLILIRAFYVIPASIINKKLMFKSLAKINLLVSFTSVSVSILLAYIGCGVWSLLIRNIIIDMSLTILYFVTCRCKLSIGFDKSIFKELFGFGFFVVLSNMIESAYANFITFLIGKRYSVKDLGYYNQAYSLQQIPVYSMTSVLNQVLFPYFSKIQDNEEQVRNKLRYSIQLTTFFVFPLLLFLIVYADQIIILLYSNKWLPCIQYFRLFCVAGFFNAIIHINRSLLKSKGHTKLIFNIQIFNAILGVALLMIGLRYSVTTAVIAFVVNIIILFVLTAYISGSKIDYNIIRQAMDVLPNMLIAAICLIPCYLIFENLYFNIFVKVLLEFLFFLCLYFCCHYALKTTIIKTLLFILGLSKK